MTDLPVGNPTHRSPAALPVIFTLTIFLSASLLFFVQPLFAKIVLPVIGGAPAVWTTAMLFFQTILIVGYLYAHISTRCLPVRAQVAVHLALWALALFFLPPALPEAWRLDASGSIAVQTLGLFALGVGAPFALLSANAPLIQSWYAKSGGPSAEDPYFLYGASNLGSLVALLGFPLLAERYFGAGEIALGFSIGFVALGAGLLTCGGSIFSRQVEHQETVATRTSLNAGTLLYWAVLAFVPSSLMLAVTSKISTDIGAVPLVWVIPLALFLLTFVLSFTGRTIFKGHWLTQAAQLSTVGGLCLFLGVGGVHLEARQAALLVLAFFFVTVWAHRTLYEARPDAANLTVFYVTMSVGGAAGGLFNSILAPALFADFLEGTITLLVALVLCFQTMLNLTMAQLFRGLGMGAAIGLALALVAISFALPASYLPFLIVAALGALYVVARKPFNSFVVTAGLVTILPIWLAKTDDRLLVDRSFFGLHQVVDQAGTRDYINGTTVHGAQRLTDYETDRPQPSKYYHPAGPMGQILASKTGQDANSIGIVGLGVGALACYAQPDQNWHFYEIDAMVDRVARDPNLFTFLSSCTPDAPTHLGDARVVLEDQTDLKFDILVIDAYSSGAVPVHLTTHEAMELYRDRLTETGVLIYHVSNNYYDIGLPLARSAQALGISAWRHNQKRPSDVGSDYLVSDVVMLAKNPAVIADLLETGAWIPLTSDGQAVWTDDRANTLDILKPGALWR